MDPRRHGRWVAGVVAVLVVACGGSPTVIETPAGSVQTTTAPSVAAALGTPTTPMIDPSGAPTPATGPSPSASTPAATPGASEPPDDSLPRSASVERDGVKVTVQVAQNPLHAGERTAVSTTVKNTGGDTLHWSVDGCGVNAWAWAELPGVHWRPSAIETTPLLRAYSAWLQTEAKLDAPIRLRFEPGWLSGMRDYGCADIGIGRSLKPGASMTDELVWDGQATDRLGPPPTSPAVIAASFDHWYRGTADSSPQNQKPIVVTLDSWVVGGPAPAFLSPAEAIDSALADPAFADWIITQPFNDRRDGVTEYDPDVDVWMVGLIHDRDDQRSLLHAALVDPLTGRVIAIREHEVR